MKIAITDANIFIDLIHIGLHGKLFSLGFELHTSYEVFDELSESQQHALQPFVDRGDLTVNNCDEISPIESVRKMKGLSSSDKSVLYLASHLSAMVLSGDGLVRKVAGVQKIELHGVFWLLDRIIEKKLVTKKLARKALQKLMSYNKRLPIDECNKRLSSWT